MRKENNLPHKFLSKIIVFCFVVLVLVPVSSAQEPDPTAPTCDNIFKGLNFLHFKTTTFCLTKKINESVDVSRTMLDMAVSLTTDAPLAMILHTNADDLSMCAVYNMAIYADELGSDGSGMLTQLVKDDGTPVFSKSDIDEANRAGPLIGCNFNETTLGTRRSGSLIGMTKQAYKVILKDPVPVNLAYYVNDNLKRMPVVNQTALAATSYNAWGLEMFLVIWRGTRDLAYAMMAVIMLIIGIMIVMRKKISPQAVLTAQQAVPRVIISLILITFSYPIGAIFASAIIPLSIIAVEFFISTVTADWAHRAGSGVTPGVESMMDMNKLIAFLYMVGMTMGIGLVSLISIVLLLLVMLVVALVVAFKFLVINLKILLAIVFAPIQFALAAIPGQEHMIMDWFKQMIARVLTIPAMFLMVTFAWYLVYVPFSPGMFPSLISNADPATAYFTLIRSHVSSSLSIAIIPLLSTMVMFYSLKMEKVIEEFIVGAKGGKRK